MPVGASPVGRDGDSLSTTSNVLTVASSTSKGALIGVAVGLVFPPLALPLGVVGWVIGGAVGGIVGGTGNVYAKRCVLYSLCYTVHGNSTLLHPTLGVTILAPHTRRDHTCPLPFT